MLRKIVSISLVLAVVLSFAAPGLAGDEPPVKISIALWDIEPDALNDDPIYKMICEKFNIEIDPIPLTWDDYTEKVNMWVNTLDIPDVFTTDLLPYYGPQYQRWVREGVIHAIPSDLSKYPNLKKIFEPDDVKQVAAIDGTFYCIPRGGEPCDGFGWWSARTLIYRKDWAQALGLAEPANLYELADFVRAILDSDPAGTGVKDIVGITAYDKGFLKDCLWPSIEPRPFASWQVEEDGTVTKAYDAPHSYEAALAIRNMYNEGLIDPDIMVQDTSAGSDKFATNKAAVVCFQATDNWAWIFDPFTANNPDLNIEDCIGYIKPLRNVYDGNAYIWNGVGFWSETYISADVDEVKLDRILRLADYFASKEFIDIQKYGLEGEDYRREGDDIVYLTPDGARPNLLEKYRFLNGFGYAIIWPNLNEIINQYPYAIALANEYRDWVNANCTLTPTAFVFDTISTPLREEFVDDSETAYFTFMLGKSGGDPRAEWDAMINALKAAGLDAMIEEVAEAAREAGLIK